MMPNVLQYPVAMMGILRAGYTVVNVNPLYTPRELEHQLKDSGAEAIVILENFARTLQAVLARTPRQACRRRQRWATCSACKGLLVNFVVRRVKKLVPAWSLPGHTSFNAALKEGAALELKPVKASGRTTSPSCNTPAARRAFPRARRSPIATFWPTSCS